MDIEQIGRRQGQKTLPWIEKYRPENLSDLVSHEGILTTLKNFSDLNNLPNLLFYGPPGTGKTSTIKALAKELYKKDYMKMVLELNASDERGIDVVRNQIKNFASNKTLSLNNNLKLIILDQAEMMTQASQFALRRIIEKYTNNARFCLISNYVSKIIPALQSRCTRFKFKQIPFDDAIKKIYSICQQQSVNIDNDAIKTVFKLCEGDMRRVVNMLQSLNMVGSNHTIQPKDVYSFTGNPSPQVLQSYLNSLLNDSLSKCLNFLQENLKQNGISMQTLVKQLYLMLLGLKMTQGQKMYITQRMAEIEYRLSIGCQEKMALGSLVSAFSQIKRAMSEQ